jgi:hypothetical protein
MKNNSYLGPNLIPSGLSDFVMLAGFKWQKNPEGRIYTELKGKKIYLEEEVPNLIDDWTEHGEVDGLFPGFELPLVDSQGDPLENTFAIVPIQYFDWLQSVGPWYYDEQCNSIYARISDNPLDCVYLRDVVWTRLATDCFAEALVENS